MILHTVTPFCIIDDNSIISNIMKTRIEMCQKAFDNFPEIMINGDLSEDTIIDEEVIYMITTDNNDFIGSAILAPFYEDIKCSIIQSFFIAEKYRGKGYGKILLDKICNDGIANYINPIEVLRIDTDSWNLPMVHIIENQLVNGKHFELFHRSKDQVDCTKEDEALYYNMRLK